MTTKPQKTVLLGRTMMMKPRALHGKRHIGGLTVRMAKILVALDGKDGVQ
jgi:hypothetical protein